MTTAAATATATEALSRAQAESRHASQDWTAYCLKFVRTCWGVPAAASDAITAWNQASQRHSGDKHVPVGAPVFWNVGHHGHIAVYAGSGKVWSTDIRRKGKVDLVPIKEINKRWGATFLGWTGDLNGVDLFVQTPAPHPAPVPAAAPAAPATPHPAPVATRPSQAALVIPTLTVTQVHGGLRVQWPHVPGATGYLGSFDGQNWYDLKYHNALGGTAPKANAPKFRDGQLVRVMARAYDAAGPGPITDIVVKAQ